MSDQNTTVTLQLSLGVVNYILGCLAKQPFEQVNGLIQEIDKQAVAQLEAQKSEE